MPTTVENTLKRELEGELRRQGVAWAFVGDWPAKATYYKPDGEAMPNLPADPWSMQNYLRRGFTLAPPVTPVNDDLVCDVCGAGPFKRTLAVAGHKRTHEKENKT